MQKKSSCFTTRRMKNTKIYLMNKPHTKIRNLNVGTKNLSTKIKKILPVSQREGQTRVYKSLMEPKQHIIK